MIETHMGPWVCLQMGYTPKWLKSNGQDDHISYI